MAEKVSIMDEIFFPLYKCCFGVCERNSPTLKHLLLRMNDKLERMKKLFVSSSCAYLLMPMGNQRELPGAPSISCQTAHPHTSYLSFFLHEQNFLRIKFTPKKRVNYDKIHRKLPIFCVITAKYTVNCQFFALNL